MALKQVLRHPISTISTLLSDPINTAFQVRERVVDRLSHTTPINYQSDAGWEATLASHLGLPADNEFEPLL